jgi:uncharacterized protein YndB with AHSA1/START domain
MMASIKMEAYFPYPPYQVWNALTLPDALEQWLMKNEGFRPVEGSRFTFRAKPMLGWDGIARCVILAVDSPRMISWSQCGNDEGKDPFTITWTLQPEGEGTRLKLNHEGLKGVLGLAQKKIMGAGWKRMFDQRIPVVLKYASNKGWDQFPKDHRLVETDCHA